MSEKDSYTQLVEEFCTTEVGVTGQVEYIRCRVERVSPTTDWEKCWRLARLPGLGPDNISFLFKMMHDLLPTQKRVSRTKPRASPACPMPGCSAESEDLPHSLVLCEGNDGVGVRMLTCLRSFVPDLDVSSALRLELEV